MGGAYAYRVLFSFLAQRRQQQLAVKVASVRDFPFPFLVPEVPKTPAGKQFSPGCRFPFPFSILSPGQIVDGGNWRSGRMKEYLSLRPPFPPFLPVA